MICIIQSCQDLVEALGLKSDAKRDVSCQAAFRGQFKFWQSTTHKSWSLHGFTPVGLSRNLTGYVRARRPGRGRASNRMPHNSRPPSRLPRTTPSVLAKEFGSAGSSKCLNENRRETLWVSELSWTAEAPNRFQSPSKFWTHNLSLRRRHKAHTQLGVVARFSILAILE
jgi:hypothetical protein